jgi:tetratricopeptide (TPR) repeat protein
MSDGDSVEKIADGLTKATRCYTAGDLQAAIQILENLEVLARPPKDQGLALILIQKAGWLREMGRTKEASSALDEAESLCLTMPPERIALSALRMEQGIVARQSGDLKKAESLLNNAQDLAMGSPIEVLEMSDILANLSSVYADQGRLKEAQSALLAALEYDQKTQDSRAFASDLNMLGLLYLNAGDRKTARLYLGRSRDTATQAGLVKELSDATHNLAVLSDLEGRSTEAKSGFTAELDNQLKGSGREIASAKTSLGIMAVREGKFEDARHLISEALEVHSALHLTEFCVNDLFDLTNIELSLSNPRQALEYAERALAIAEEHGLLQKLWRAYYGVAWAQMSVLQQEQTPDVAALNEVLANLTKAVDSIEILRAGLGRPEEREHLLVDKEEVYAMGMMLAGTLRHGTMAWTFAERSRGRAFLDLLGARRISTQAAKHPLSIRRAEITERLFQLHDMNGPEARALLDEVRLVRSLISAQAPAIATVTETELPDIKEVAAAIPPDTAVVEFFRGPGNSLSVFVLDQKGFAAMNTVDCGQNDVAGLVEQFRAEVQYSVPDEPTGNLLCTLLFGGVWNAIAPVSRLMIVPHRELHYVPMSALWFHNSGEGPTRLYLCQRFQMSVIPSAYYLVHLQKLRLSRSTSRRSLVIGNPTNDLPAAEAEAVSISQLLGVRPVLGADAVRDRVLRLDEMQAVIHIASHGTFNERDPLLSGLLLADDILSVQDLLDAQIPTDLLTLSGCLTGKSADQPGDELVGLSRAALAAGVPSIITALWEVPDDPTREFFSRFYAYLLQGMNKDEAMGTVQRSMLADQRYSKPANWAPYVLMGDCR